MENKILINLYVPSLEKKYELFIYAGKSINESIYLISKALNELTGEYFEYNRLIRLYDRNTGKEYSSNEIIKNSGIKNGHELILI